jgi:dienelactone hydrolase
MKALLVAGAAAVVLTTPGAGAQITGRMLRVVAALYYANAGRVALVTGRDTTMDYYDRLLDDADQLTDPAPDGYPPALWQRTAQAASRLDVSLATQLLHNSYLPLSGVRGLSETLVRSSKDGTMQPAAVYVPSTYSSARPAPLVIFLHGSQQTESRLLALPYVEDVAESTGTIVVAPYGRGAYDFQGAEGDVYDALDSASRAFAIDPHRRYLAGYSMGGFSVFRIAPMRPNDWSAVMTIAGSLLASRARRLVATMSNARFYVLTGALDDNVPTLWPTATAIFLRSYGLSVAFYSKPDGTHALYSLRTILAQAWNDMERGVVRSPAGLTGAANLPDAPTMPP